jgi:hypothetical protein
MDVAEARSLVLGLPGVSEHDHFDRPAYRIRNAKGKPSTIFLTLWLDDHRAVLMLNVEQQADLHARHPEAFFPVPNKWGAKGATFVELALVDPKLLRAGIVLAVTKALGT